MKIVDRATFLALPRGTLYAEWTPCYFGALAIKDETWPSDDDNPARGDWLYQEIVDAVAFGDGDRVDELDELAARSLATGASIPMDFDGLSRDGLYEPDQLFAVWEPQDVQALIVRLQRAIVDATAGHADVSAEPDGAVWAARRRP